MSDEIDPGDLQLLQDPQQVLRLGLLLVADARMRGESHAAQIRHDDGVAAHHDDGERLPHVAGVPEAMQHQYRRPLAPDAHVNGGAVGLDVQDLE